MVKPYFHFVLVKKRFTLRVDLPTVMGLKQGIYLLLFIHGTFVKLSFSDKKVMGSTVLMPSATSGKTSSVLREMLNQESLVRFSMVQRIQKLFMDVIENKDNTQNVKKRLSEVIEDLHALEKREQDLEIKNSNLSQKINAINEVMTINKNLSMEEIKDIDMLRAELKSKSDDSDTRLELLEDSLRNFSIAVNKTLGDIHENQKAYAMQLKDIHENQKTFSIASQFPSECSPGKFGEKCSSDCGHCKDDAPCDFVYGTCALGCSNGWTGIICTEQCPSGQFGDRCSEYCGHCHDNAPCDFINGTCPRGCSQGWIGDFCKEAYSVDCLEIMDQGEKISGIYRIYPWKNSTYKEVLCDMDTMGGGWTVFQKRIDGSVSFSRNWTEYQHGFGNASTEYWLGNDALHALTVNSSSLYLKIQNKKGRHYFRYYSDFRISGADDDYRLHLGSYSNGTAEDYFSPEGNNKTFKTPDHSPPIRCFSAYSEGGWWFGNCHNVYLNGVYGSSEWGFPWYGVINSGTDFRSSQMMIRRNN